MVHLKMEMAWFGLFITKIVDAFGILAEDGGSCTPSEGQERSFLGEELPSLDNFPVSDTEISKTSPLSFSSAEMGMRAGKGGMELQQCSGISQSHKPLLKLISSHISLSPTSSPLTPGDAAPCLPVHICRTFQQNVQFQFHPEL